MRSLKYFPYFKCASFHQQEHAGSKPLLLQNPPVLNWCCWLTQTDLCNDHKTVVVPALQLFIWELVLLSKYTHFSAARRCKSAVLKWVICSIVSKRVVLWFLMNHWSVLLWHVCMLQHIGFVDNECNIVGDNKPVGRVDCSVQQWDGSAVCVGMAEPDARTETTESLRQHVQSCVLTRCTIHCHRWTGWKG